MPRRYFRKFMPKQRDVRDSRLLRVFGTAIFHPRLWQLNRHSTALGIASGVFWAWIALPLQTVGAVATAWVGRGNVPLAMAATWLSNPITWVPCFLLAYEVGLLVTGADRVHGLKEQVEEVMGAGLIGGVGATFRFLGTNFVRLYPMYVGGALIGLLSGAGAYLAVVIGWRWNVARRWHRRHLERKRNNPTLRFTTGLCHLARLRRAGQAA